MEEDNYYYDFTTASDLELFVARLEEVIQLWGLNGNREEEPSNAVTSFNNEFISVSESVSFSGL